LTFGESIRRKLQRPNSFSDPYDVNDMAFSAPWPENLGGFQRPGDPSGLAPFCSRPSAQRITAIWITQAQVIDTTSEELDNARRHSCYCREIQTSFAASKSSSRLMKVVSITCVWATRQTQFSDNRHRESLSRVADAF
jgi:hypothetical protein